MTNLNNKWRESLIDVSKLPLKSVDSFSIVSYPPAGNDVFECMGVKNNKIIYFFIKSERSKFANFETEADIIMKLKNILPIPELIEKGIFQGHNYLVLKKMPGNKLSYLINEKIITNKEEYFFEYGKTLSKIHSLSVESEKAMQRIINDYPTKETYGDFNKWEEKVIDYLKNNCPKDIKYNTFIHGDFHYANILWLDNKISAILDWEYAGLGFKEQDIAWSLILRPNQRFLDNKEDVISFLKGYKEYGNYNPNYLKWCYINGCMHFYLMNKKNSDLEYLEKLKQIINYHIITSFFNEC